MIIFETLKYFIDDQTKIEIEIIYQNLITLVMIYDTQDKKVITN
jgi:hypothetical protein